MPILTITKEYKVLYGHNSQLLKKCTEKDKDLQSAREALVMVDSDNSQLRNQNLKLTLVTLSAGKRIIELIEDLDDKDKQALKTYKMGAATGAMGVVGIYSLYWLGKKIKNSL